LAPLYEFGYLAGFPLVEASIFPFRRASTWSDGLSNEWSYLLHETPADIFPAPAGTLAAACSIGVLFQAFLIGPCCAQIFSVKLAQESQE